MSNIITAGNATNNGTSISSDTSGVLELKTGSTPTTAIAVDTSQRVGIGTTSPGANLEVKGASGQNIYVSYTSGSQLRLKSDSGDSGVGTTGSTPLLFLINNGEVGRFDTSGNLKFNSGYGSVATAYGCRAWVNFNGTGTPAIRSSGNVTSLTDVGTGRYNINFTTAMPDTNYATNVTGDHLPGVYYCTGATTRTDAYTTTYMEANFFNNSLGFQDPTIACVTVFR